VWCDFGRIFGFTLSRNVIGFSMKKATLIFSIFLSIQAFAQEPQDYSSPGNVTYDMDFRVKELMERYIKSSEANPTSNGWRVQVYSGTRDGANKAKSEWQNPSIEHQFNIYVAYEQPYFKTRIGDFRTKLEAEKLIRTLGAACSGCFVVKDKIKLIPEKE
jgi:hypothetical protein